MKTIIKYNLSPPNKPFEVVDADVEQIIKTYIAKKIPVDELIIEVSDIFFVSQGSLNVIQKSCNGNRSGHSAVVQIS